MRHNCSDPLDKRGVQMEQGGVGGAGAGAEKSLSGLLEVGGPIVA